MKTTLTSQEIELFLKAEHPDSELKLFREGKYHRLYNRFGCHLMTLNEISGAFFAVWAPNAGGVSVIGDFNGWNGQKHPMRQRKETGVWELFIPGIKEGERYQYEMKTPAGGIHHKSDPYGFHFEVRPNTSSIVTDIDHFSWTDLDWMIRRKHTNPLKSPISVYEVHLGSWMRKDGQFLSYRELAETLIPYVKEMGFTHIELLPVSEHPFDGSWGYQVSGYYAPTSRHGTPEEFMYFVNACHCEEIGIIMDWVPSHFPKDPHFLSNFDGTCLYEYDDPRLGEHKDWGTLIFDYRKNEVRNFLLSNAIFWFEKFHIDGIRVDAVSSMLYLDYSREEGEWIPNKYGGPENLEAIDFLKELNTLLQERFPGTITIAEESTSWLGVTYPAYLGGLEFTFKWNLGWMNDMLHYMSHDPIYRKFVHNIVSFVFLYAFHEHFMLELSHDEVVHGKGSLLGKMPGEEWQKFANLRALYGFMFGHPGKKLLFMGSEFGQSKEWNHETSLEWELLQYGPHQGLQRFVRDLNRLYILEPALYVDDIKDRCFDWIDYHDYDNSAFSFMRKTVAQDEQIVIFVCNFTPVPRHDYRVGVPLPGCYHELINSDAEKYGGSTPDNSEGYHADQIPWQKQPYSLCITLPPLSTLILKPVGEKETIFVVEDTKEPESTVTEKPRIRVAGGPGIKAIETQKTHPRNRESIAVEVEGQELEAARSQDIRATVYHDSQVARPQGSKAAIDRDSKAPKYRKSG